ncbi:13988_t:CDS:2, partial [Dentiscutata erythropus]
DKELIKDVILTHLTPLIAEKFKNFARHARNVHSTTPIEPAGTSQSPTPIATSFGSATTTSSTKPKFVNTTTITETVELQTSADQVYETLLDPGRVAAWTRSRTDIFRHIGSTFSNFSTVTLEFEQESDYTRVNVTQKGVPVGEEEIVKRNWKNYYWNPIKSVFG